MPACASVDRSRRDRRGRPPRARDPGYRSDDEGSTDELVIRYNRLMPHIERRPAFEAYLARCFARDAHRRASQRTDALVAQLEG